MRGWFGSRRGGGKQRCPADPALRLQLAVEELEHPHLLAEPHHGVARAGQVRAEHRQELIRLAGHEERVGQLE